MRLLFCLFADSVALLPDHLFRQMIELDKTRPANFTRKLRQLFAAMAVKGSSFGPHDIHYFNGGLFADDEVFDLTSADMAILKDAAALDWSQVEPAIFGTLFERGLDPGKRAQLGAHHTSREDILLIVEPVIIEPLQRRWTVVKAEALMLVEAAEKERLTEAAAKKKGTAYQKLRSQLQDALFNWVEELSAVRVLDPACGSGNFLYLALRRLLDLWHEARVFSAEHDLPTCSMETAIVSGVGTAVDLYVKLVKAVKDRKKENRQKTIFECAQRLRHHSDSCKRENPRHRYFLKEDLAKQLEGNAHLIDEALANMEERGAAKSFFGIPDLWEIAPFSDNDTTDRWKPSW
jgi:hypothetical protein